MATEEEVKAEFAARHQKIEQKKQKEQEKKMLRREQRREEFSHRGGEEEVKAMDLWDEKMHKNTEFFSTYEPTSIFQDITK